MGWDDHQDVYACHATEAKVFTQLDSYAEQIMKKMSAEISGSTVAIPTQEDAVGRRNRIRESVERNVRDDKMPYGPRVHHTLACMVERCLLRRNQK